LLPWGFKPGVEGIPEEQERQGEMFSWATLLYYDPSQSRLMMKWICLVSSASTTPAEK
jgi:hypothetical protein